MSLAAIVLAAGESKRLGRPKQLVLLDGEPLLRRVVRLALEAGCSPVVVVLGAAEQPCRAALAGQGRDRVHVVKNKAWREGMATSLRAGLGALQALLGLADSGSDGRGRGTSLEDTSWWKTQSGSSDPRAAMVLVCDQVGLTAGSLRLLLRAHLAGQAPVTAARYSGRLGVPAIFGAELWPKLAALQGDQGARRLLERWADRAQIVDLPEAAFEVDTPEDLAALERGSTDRIES